MKGRDATRAKSTSSAKVVLKPEDYNLPMVTASARKIPGLTGSWSSGGASRSYDRYSEPAANLLIHIGPNFSESSERALI